MLINTISLTVDHNNNWVCNFTTNIGDRVDKKTIPHSMGFYHYDKEKYSKQEAFNAVKHMLLKQLKDTRTELDTKINNLEQFGYIGE